MTTFLTKQSTKIEVQAATMAELVSFHNDVTGKTIKKFETRAKGVERCLALLSAQPTVTPLSALAAAVTNGGKQQLPAKRSAGPVKGEARNFAGPSATVKKPAGKKPLITKGKMPGVAGAPARFDAETARITVLHKGENPKHGTAAERYSLYRTGMTVAAYISAGGQRRDVVWDAAQGWISVK